MKSTHENRKTKRCTAFAALLIAALAATTTSCAATTDDIELAAEGPMPIAREWHGDGGTNADHLAVKRLAGRWVAAVATRDEAFAGMLSARSVAYYGRLKRLALHAEVHELERLDAIDQLQGMLLRLMFTVDELQAMSERDLLISAVDRGLIGYDLRRADVLREISINGASAQGRLYKFGLQNQPDRTLQYFVKEDGQWHVDLQGELRRLRADFDAFLEHSGLSRSEGMFFILEARVMRKITSEDFVPPLALVDDSRPADRIDVAPPQRGVPLPTTEVTPILRLVAVRRPIGSLGRSAVTIEDRMESLRYVLEKGDTLPSHPRYRLGRIEERRVVLRADDVEISLNLDVDGDPLNQRMRPAAVVARRHRRSLLRQAELGDGRSGLMAQWRNVGLRGRSQLLQQAWLTPVYANAGGPDRRMTGLRVNNLVDGSFWHQLGLEEGDLLEEVNGLRLDSLDAWQRLMRIAESALRIEIKAARREAGIAFVTDTIRPRPSAPTSSDSGDSFAGALERPHKFDRNMAAERNQGARPTEFERF